MTNTTEKKVGQAHQEWIAALDVVEDAIFMHDKEFRILRCNRAYQRLAALPFAQIIGQLYFDIFPKTHAPLQHCLQEMENTVAEEVQVGDTLFRSHAYAIKDEQGGYLYSLHTLEDITERQHIQRALQESEMQYRRLFEAAKEGILILDAQTGVIVDANPFILRLLSYTLDECTGKKLWEIGLFADIEESKAAFRELQSKKYIRYDDLPLKTKDGRQINVEFVSNMYEVNGQKVIQCNIRDITERLRAKQALSESEMQYRRLFETAKEGILILDAETGVIVDANPFILALLSYSLNEFIGKKLWEIGFFTDIEASKEAFEELQTKGYIRYEDLPLKTKDGRQINVEFISNLYEAGDWKIIQCNIRDISERRRAQEMLIASHELFQSVVENIPIRIFWKDTNLRYLGCNASFARDAGMSSPQEVIGKDDFQMLWSDQAKSYRADDKKVMDSGIPKIGYEEVQTTPEGSQICLRTSKVPLRATDGSIFGILGVYDDITERKQAEERLKLLRTLIDHSSDAIEVIEPSTMHFLDINDTDCRILGYTREEMLSMTIFDIDPVFDAESAKAIEEQLRKSGSVNFETMHRRKDGSTFPVEVSTKLIELTQPYMLSIVRDITERKVAAEALRASEEKFHSITASAQDAIIMIDDEGRISYWNEAAERMFSYPLQEVIGQSLHTLIAPARFLAAHNIAFSHFKNTGEGPAVGKTLELAALKKDGTEFPVELSLSAVMRDGHWNAIGIIRDITERKQSEESLRRANRALRTLSAGNEALIRAENEDALLRSVTRIIVEQGSYSLAVVDYADENPQKSITPMAWSGLKEKDYWAKNLSWADTEQGQLPISKVIRTGTTQICRDISSEDGFNPYKDAARSHGYVSNIALPLSYEGKTFGALSIYSSISEPFDEEEVRLLEELANDLAYGIITLRARIEHEQHATILRESLEQSIQIIAATVEARDPYTAGHQRRVGELATAIAQEMGLSEEQIEGVHFAAIIHDLGKIHIPAEILSKPGKLNDIEYMLIKTHPQAGYDILKDVKFPWPIAEIILQHHEKLDGSGYPRGLKGDQILLESKIITVADVVEAMSSHRPYRSALGNEKALDEIRRGRGVIYDPAVVDACLKLFTEKRFAFSNEFL